ncbi:MAG: beta-galactosidase [Anaerolineae bacterium]|nr:beta-galactosidase [Anaerolineae bacterium]
MQFGICYYPEQWPEDQWELDARMMQEAGLEIVRIAEFAWHKMEPSEGQFAWDWLDRVIAVLTGAGLKLVLGTPTAAPPAWLTRTYPELLRVDSSGRSRDHGTRRHICLNNPTYRQHSGRVTQAMAQRYGQHPDLIGWQVDNEFGGGGTARCYCPACAEAFRLWVQARYGEIEMLNEAWGTVFWSQTYDNWAQIRPPSDQIDKPNPSHVLDYYRFASDSVVSYQQEQIEMIRSLSPGRFVTHNFMGMFRDLNQFDLARPLDFITWDNYPTGNTPRWRPHLVGTQRDFRKLEELNPQHSTLRTPLAWDTGDPLITGMAHDLMRGLKQGPFWVMEQQAGHINWAETNSAVRPETVRLWTWHAVASGAETIVYFRWRAALMAQEQYHSGLLRHDRSPDVGMVALQRLRQEREQLDRVAAASLAPVVALLFSYDDLWALQLQPHRQGAGYLSSLFGFYQALQRLGIPVDLVAPDADWSRYRLLLAPTAHMGTPALAQRFTRFVQDGGTLLLGPRSGFKTASNLVTDTPLPGVFRDLTGVTVTSWQALPDGVTVNLDSSIVTGAAATWVETLQPVDEGVKVWARYRGWPGEGVAALTEHGVGRGRVFTLGFWPTDFQALSLIATIADGLAQPRSTPLPDGLLAIPRGEMVVLLNFTAGPITTTINGNEVTVGAVDCLIVNG